MEKNNLTVWQRLSKTFGPNSLLNQDYPTYQFDKTELLRTQSKQEYEKEKLQAQQNRAHHRSHPPSHRLLKLA